MEFERDVMAEKRETLTKMLMSLMDQKNDRAKELQSRLKEMDDQRNADTENYWLIQYQKLMDSKPKVSRNKSFILVVLKMIFLQSMMEAEANIDSALKEVLTNAGAEEFMPIFAMKNITLKQLSYMKDKELSELGVHNTYIRQKILMCAEEFASMQERLAQKMSGLGDGASTAPTAPPAVGSDAIGSAPPLPPPSEVIPANGKLSEANGAAAAATAPIPSAPPVETFQSNECVVCMENKVQKENFLKFLNHFHSIFSFFPV